MAEKTVPVYVVNDGGNHVQVGWATPNDGSGVRSVNLLEGFESTSIATVHFDDVEPFNGADLNPATTQEPPRTYEESVEPFTDLEGNVIEEPDPEVHYDSEVPQTGSEVTEPEEIPEVPLPSEPIEVAPDEELAAEPIDNQPDELEEDPEWAALVAEEEAAKAAAEVDEDTAPADEGSDES